VIRPYQSSNIPGPHTGIAGTPALIALAIKKAKRPVLITGSDAQLNWISEFIKTTNMPVVSTASAGALLRQHDIEPERDTGLIEIVNLLKTPQWKGIRGEGPHDLAIFTGITNYLENQMLSTLKNFAPHLTTISLSRGFQPNADISLANLSREEYENHLTQITKALKSELKYSYLIDPLRCTDCNDCVIACRKEHGEERIVKSKRGFPIFCLHCDPEEATCAAVCPTLAIQNLSGILMVNKERCIGCGMCRIACPVGHIRSTNTTALKCTLCMDSSSILPACLSACRDSAITLKANMKSET
jgi:acetyl-CoA decarbonylase/synthase complex subunit epsilon